MTENYEILEMQGAILKGMTVCIAALSDNGKKALLVADKMVTSQGALPYQKEDAEKIIKINDNVSVLSAGSLTETQTILGNVIKTLGAKKYVKEIAEYINEKYLEYLFTILERQHVIGRGIEGGIPAFYNDKNLNLSVEERKEITTILSTYNLNSNTAFIVCGKESDGTYRIYTCGPNPRFIPSLVTEYYASIGSGATYALNSILFSDYKPSMTLVEVRKIVLEAKKRAEKSHDVGEKEDIVELG
jgi:20S proteasome alpha/beta subunit